MALWDPDRLLAAWNYAAEAHAGQKLTGTELPYLNHVGTVAMEVMHAIAERRDVDAPDLAVQCALLHDVVEDTPVTVEHITAEFGATVAAGVAALTKNEQAGDKAQQMTDSLERIRRQPTEVWMVKLADRITNLQPPPKHWSLAKRTAYREEAGRIHDALAAACPVLAPRLLQRIDAYSIHLQ